MKNIPLFRSCFFLFLFVISSNALPMMRHPDPFDREDKSVSPEQDKRTRELTNSSNDASGSKARRTDGKFPAENDDNEFGIFHTVSSAITPLRNKALSLTISCKQRLISKLELNNLPTYIEQIIATASEKHNAAVAAANANNERLGETALAVKQREFNKLANLWVKVAEISSLLKDETNQLRELTKKNGIISVAAVTTKRDRYRAIFSSEETIGTR